MEQDENFYLKHYGVKGGENMEQDENFYLKHYGVKGGENMEQDENFYLQHYGVKGMKWGVRKDEVLLRKIAGDEQRIRTGGGTKEERKAAKKQAKQDWKDYKKSTTRSERRSDRQTARAEKAAYLYETVKNDPAVMVETRDPRGYKTLIAGKVFITHLENGGALNVPSTEISDFRMNVDEDD